jgi:hypothetical protein
MKHRRKEPEIDYTKGKENYRRLQLRQGLNLGRHAVERPSAVLPTPMTV